MADELQREETPTEIALSSYHSADQLPGWLTLDMLVDAFHNKMKPFHDTLEDVRKALEYGLGIDRSKPGGLLTTATAGERLLGGVLMLRTGMSGYVPPWILLMVYVDPVLRGQGIGRKLIEYTRALCDGDIKLHVEHDNPARRLYERVGFTSKYLEMRLKNS